MTNADAGTQLDMSKVSVQADVSLLSGKYGNVINASLSSNELTLDFIYVDPTTVNQENPTGYLQARVVLSHSNLKPLIDVLQRQLNQLENIKKAAKDAE